MTGWTDDSMTFFDTDMPIIGFAGALRCGTLPR
jgi:hypothetical protein